MLKKLPQYDLAGIAIVLLIVTGVIGNHLLPIDLGGVSLFFFRLLLILMAAFVFRKFNIMNFRYNSPLFWFFHFCIIWLVYGLVMVVFVSKFSEGFKEWVGLVWGVIIFFMFSQLFLRAGPKMPFYFCVGVMLANLICIPVGVWEVLTLNHLSSYYISNLPDYALDRQVAITFLDNPNGYAYFMGLSQPFVYYLFTIKTNKLIRLGTVITTIMTPYLLFYTDARFSIVVFLMNLFLFVAVVMKSKLNVYGISMVAIMVSLLMVFGGWKYFSDELNTKLDIDSQTTSKETFEIRVAHMKNCIYYSMKTGGFGLGPGTYENMSSYNKPYFTFGNESPHNFLVEISLSYGVYIGVGFFIFIFMCLRNYDISTTFGFCILITTVSFFLLAAQNSTYLKSQITWIFLSVIFFRMAPIKSEANNNGLNRGLLV